MFSKSLMTFFSFLEGGKSCIFQITASKCLRSSFRIMTTYLSELGLLKYLQRLGDWGGLEAPSIFVLGACLVYNSQNFSGTLRV